MMNFDFHHLLLVSPCELNDDCYARAMHARSLVENASIYSTFTEATASMDYLVATSSIASKTDKKHLRNPLLLQDFTEKIFEIKGNVGLVFGREDYGLYNSEISQCDVMVQIPTSESYLSLNLSHAVTLVLYFLFIEQKYIPKMKRTMGKIEKEKLYEHFSHLLEEIQYPDHKKEHTKIMLKRMMGRAMPSTWEYHTLMGVISRTLEELTRKKQ
jgi:TrmH family RNA methyltransferase